MCVQWVSEDQGTYLMAKKDDFDPDVTITFDLGGNPTIIKAPFLLPFELGTRILAHFFKTGTRSDEIEWVYFGQD